MKSSFVCHIEIFFLCRRFFLCTKKRFEWNGFRCYLLIFHHCDVYSLQQKIPVKGRSLKNNIKQKMKMIRKQHKNENENGNKIGMRANKLILLFLIYEWERELNLPASNCWPSTIQFVYKNLSEIPSHLMDRTPRRAVWTVNIRHAFCFVFVLVRCFSFHAIQTEILNVLVSPTFRFE